MSKLLTLFSDFQNRTRYDWTQEQQGWILSAFYVGYLVSHLPGSILAQQFSAKWTLSLGILISTICNFINPLALEYGEPDEGFFQLSRKRFMIVNLFRWRKCFDFFDCVACIHGLEFRSIIPRCHCFTGCLGSAQGKRKVGLDCIQWRSSTYT